jgi:hypothetical protein
LDQKEHKYSNCLIEALKAFIKSPLNTRIYLLKLRPTPHFFWLNKKEQKSYHFRSLDENLPAWQVIWFRGKIDEIHTKEH